MAETSKMQRRRMMLQLGNWIAWLGMIVGIISFAWQPQILAPLSILLGLIAYFTPARSAGILAFTIGLLSQCLLLIF